MSESRLYVPIASRVFTRCREKYTRQLKKLNNPYVAIYIDRTFVPEQNEKNLADLKVNLEYLKNLGFDTLVWIQAFGFGIGLQGRDAECAAAFTRITDLDGRVCDDAMCPEDPAFMEYYRSLVQGVIRAGARRIMLDDDLCLSVRPGLGCSCERHLALLKERIGREITREELKNSLFIGEPTPLRKEWLALMGDTLKTFCRRIRAAADELDPEVEMGFCAGYTSWDLEGADALTLTSILAGKHKPFLRLTGAPYWVEQNRFPGQRMPQIVEFTRMQRQWCEQQDVEFFTENDSYPRPRYRVPAAIIETFDFCMSADSPAGQLKYLFDYYSAPGYEDGYLRAHERSRPVTEKVRALIGPMPAAGVYVHEEMRKAADMPFPAQPSPAFEVMQTAFSPAASLLSSCGVPTTYAPHAGPAAAFGDSGRTIPLTGRAGYILDYPAACAMKKRGVDVGLLSGIPAEIPLTEHFSAQDDFVLLDGCVRYSAPSRFHKCTLSSAAKVQSTFSQSDGSSIPASYTYENAAGQKFLVFLFDGIAVKSNSALSCSYYRQAQMAAACEWMGASLPAFSRKNPEFYLICKQDETRMAVAFCNFSLDYAENAVIELAVPCASAEFIGCTGRLEGNRVVIDHVPAWGFGAVLLSRV